MSVAARNAGASTGMASGTKKYPACPHCGNVFRPGLSWKGSNFCKAAYLIRFVAENPGITTWGISQITGFSYSDATKGMAKARDQEAVSVEKEERDQGGFRYHHFALDGWEEICERLLAVPTHFAQDSLWERRG